MENDPLKTGEGGSIGQYIALQTSNKTDQFGISQPRPYPIKLKFYATLFFKHFDWMNNLSIQSDCLKILCSVKFTLKFFIGLGPVANLINNLRS